jgi:hypothetical protein
VALVGDAAHAMTPNLGQGACQALEDAVVLAESVDRDGGLDAYDRLRRSRTQMIALRAPDRGSGAMAIPGGRAAVQHGAPPAAPFIVHPVARPGAGLGARDPGDIRVVTPIRFQALIATHSAISWYSASASPSARPSAPSGSRAAGRALPS